MPKRPASERSTPNTYAEACAGEQSVFWGQAMDKEYATTCGVWGTYPLSYPRV